MFKKFFSQPIFKDSRAIILMVASFLLVIVHAINFALSVSPQEIKIPIRYSGYDKSLSDKGNWTALLSLVVFGILIFIINTAISIKVYHLRRTLAVAVLSMSVIIMVFLIFVSHALLNLV
jgi:hypothetical protein